MHRHKLYVEGKIVFFEHAHRTTPPGALHMHTVTEQKAYPAHGNRKEKAS